MAAMRSSGPSVPALRKYHRQVAGMLADPDLTGDLLAVGLYLAWHGCGGWEPMSPEDWARALFPPHTQHQVTMVSLGVLHRCPGWHGPVGAGARLLYGGHQPGGGLRL